MSTTSSWWEFVNHQRKLDSWLCKANFFALRINFELGIGRKWDSWLRKSNFFTFRLFRVRNCGKSQWTECPWKFHSRLLLSSVEVVYWLAKLELDWIFLGIKYPWALCQVDLVTVAEQYFAHSHSLLKEMKVTLPLKMDPAKYRRDFSIVGELWCARWMMTMTWKKWTNLLPSCAPTFS